MGFRNGKIIQHDFTPQELTEWNVKVIHHRCFLEKPEAGIRTAYGQVFTKSYAGKESPSIRFKKDELDKEKKNIKFLLGQIKAVHSGSKTMPFEYGMVHYTGKKWTTDPNILMQLYELGTATGNLSTFFQSEDNPEEFFTLINLPCPTLAPNDPNFAEWYKEYQAKKLG